MYEIQKFNGESVNLEKKYYRGVVELLKKTGKFIEISGELINISEIRAITKSKDNDYDLQKIKKLL